MTEVMGDILDRDDAVAILQASTPKYCAGLYNISDALFPESFPVVERTYEKKTFYSCKMLRSQNFLQTGSSEYRQVAFHYSEKHHVIKSNYNATLQDYESQDIPEQERDQYQEILTYGIVEHEAIIPVYAISHDVHYYMSGTRDAWVFPSISPSVIDKAYDMQYHYAQKTELNFLHTLGYQTTQDFFNSSPAAVFLQHYAKQDFTIFDRNMYPIRDTIRGALHDFCKTLTQQQSMGMTQQYAEEMHHAMLTEQQNLFSKIADLMYGWFDPALHGDYPVEWLYDVYISKDEIEEQSKVLLQEAQENIAELL